MRYGLIAFSAACVALGSSADEMRVRLQNIVAMGIVREAVAPLCGRDLHFDCPIAVDWKPQHCAIEYLVILPPERAAPGRREMWIGLDKTNHIVSVARKQELLCPSA